MDPTEVLEVRPTDRHSAEQAVASIYDRQGLPVPSFSWAGSPQDGWAQVLAYFEANRSELTGRAIERLVGSTGPICLCHHCRGVGLRSGPERQASHIQSGGFSSPERAALGRLAVVLGEEECVSTDLSWATRQRCALSNHWECAHRVMATLSEPAWWDLTVAAGGWWLFLDKAILFERPTEIHLDEDLRPNHENGPAIVYPDGWSVNAREGIHLPAGYFDPDGITIESILQEVNLERRRLLLEQFGHDRFVNLGGATLYHEDHTGQLWHVGEQRNRDRDSRNRQFIPENAFVRVVDATPDPDGDRRVYWLSVPPNAVTAKEAVAWTFGLTEEEYQPEVET